jgi:hypothetical protein
MILNEEKIADQLTRLLEEENHPLFEYEILEKLSSRQGISIEDQNRLSRILNSGKNGFGKIGQRFFNLGDNYFFRFIPRFQYIQNSLKSTIGSQSNAFVPFLFFLGRSNSFIEPFANKSIYNVGYESLHQFEYLSKEVIGELKSSFPGLSDFFSQMEILLSQFTVSNSMNSLFFEILEVLKELHLDTISEAEFSIIFDHVIQNSLESNKSGFALSDPLMSEILNWFIVEKDEVRIFDPYLGVGSFLTSLAKRSESKRFSGSGIEINKEVFEIACLNFIANGISIENLYHGDSESFSQKGEFDFVVSDLPWTGTLLSRNFNGRPTNPVHFVQNALSFCRKDGKALLFVPDNFLDSQIREIKDYRRYLVENGFVEGVVRIRTNSERKYFNKNIETLLVLRKQPVPNQSWIKFSDFSNAERPILPSDIKSFSSKFASAEGLLYLEKDILERHGYDLNPSHYDETIFESEQLINSGQAEYLEKIATIKVGGSRNFEEDLKYPVSVFSNKSFKEKFEDSYVTSNLLVPFEPETKRNPRLSLLNQEAILVSRIGRKFSPMIFRPTDELPEIFLTGEIYVIVPNSDRIDIEYLYNQFYTALVKGQIQRFSNRTVLFQIPTSKLKKVVIPTMSLPAQKEFVATQGLSIKSLEKKIEKEEKEEKSIEEEKEASQDEVVRTFVHQIRAKIQTIDNNMYMADQITRKHGLLDFKLDVEGSVGIGENPTLGEYLQLVLDQSYHLQKELEFIREVMKFNIHQDKIEKKKIKKFFQNWAEDQNKGVGRKIKIVISGQDAEVEFSPAAFRAIADQVYRNTIDHAFGEKYIEVSIQIEIINKEKTALILISNNGEPSEIDFEDFIQPFKKRNGSNGSGIGGNYISRIVKAHQGDIKQIRMSEGFGFKIEIPKKRIL